MAKQICIRRKGNAYFATQPEGTKIKFGPAFVTLTFPDGDVHHVANHEVAEVRERDVQDSSGED